MEFYNAAFGGELTLQTYKEMNMAQSPDQDNLVGHSQFVATDNMTLMGSDDPEGESYSASVAVSGENLDELRGYWDKLSDGATVLAPFETAPWGDTFGMLMDKFGIRWMINVVTAAQ
jgi:PhnB protein